MLSCGQACSAPCANGRQSIVAVRLVVLCRMDMRPGPKRPGDAAAVFMCPGRLDAGAVPHVGVCRSFRSLLTVLRVYGPILRHSNRSSSVIYRHNKRGLILQGLLPNTPAAGTRCHLGVDLSKVVANGGITPFWTWQGP